MTNLCKIRREKDESVAQLKLNHNLMDVKFYGVTELFTNSQHKSFQETKCLNKDWISMALFIHLFV